MPRPRSVFACTECGARQPRWLGRCPTCGGWETLVEEPGNASPGVAPRADLLNTDAGSRASGSRAQRLAEIDAASAPRIATGIPELDRVLGGGMVPGSVVLLGGEPGVGKSTLSLQIAAGLHEHGRVLYVTGEESPEQLRLRASRLPKLPADLLVIAETRVEALAEPWREARPAVVIVDSIQTLQTSRVESAPGSVAQVRECAALLSATAKSHGTVLILVGHVTKEGLLAGPRVLEHLVDVVLNFEGERAHPFRMLRASKNRFGSTQEVGVFSMTGEGLACVPNPSELFLAERRAGAAGSCIVPLLEGSRPMLVEIQALVAPAGYGTARRTCIGFDDGRLALLLAVLDRTGRVDLLSRDVYVNVAGGFRVSEPAADLGVALALASSRLDIPLPADVAACGEVGLGGELRRVARLELRAREAERLGFTRLLVPDGAAAQLPPRAAKSLLRLPDLGAALRWLTESAGRAERHRVNPVPPSPSAP
jgi:DNA repair protein RadA/Sms